MEAVQTTNPGFETVWANIMEKAHNEMQELSEKAHREMQELRESQKETDRITKENARLIGNLGNRFGEMVEYMVMPCLVTKFRELGFDFDETHHQREIKDKKNNKAIEIDITLENGDRVMIVEVKAKPRTEDITRHIERMQIVRSRADRWGDKRKYLGAIAGMVFNENEKLFALKNGFFVIEPSGETFAITAPEGDYSPREW